MTMLVMLAISLISFLYRGTQAAPSQLVTYHTSAGFGTTSNMGLLDELNPGLECSCPDTRTLLDILWSCITTVLVCTWVSVHPNIPPLGERKWRGILRRLKVMFWGLVAPELILGWSIRQWMVAQKIAKENSDHGWSEIHGFLFVMGGFSLMKGDEDLGTLSYGVFTDLLRAHEIDFPLILAEDIEDKSKGDPLSKALVILQTTWFIIQCIGRAVLGLAITELEIVTLAFCSLNAIVYFFWWHKPLDIKRRVPIYLKPGSSYQINSQGKQADDIEDVVRVSASIDDTMQTKRVKPLNPTFPSSIISRIRTFVRGGIVSIKRCFHKLRDTIRLDLENYNILYLVLFVWPIGRPVVFILYLIGRFVQIFIMDALTNILGDEDSENIRPGLKRVNTFYSPALENSDDFITSALYSFIGCAFGALHCLAWDFHFPTHTERLLWRSLTLIITFTPLAFVFVFFMSYSKDVDGEYRQHIKNKVLRRLEYILIWAILSLVICYIPLRLILLLQSFISLRDLPPSVLLDINWENYIPHL